MSNIVELSSINFGQHKGTYEYIATLSAIDTAIYDIKTFEKGSGKTADQKTLNATLMKVAFNSFDESIIQFEEDTYEFDSFETNNNIIDTSISDECHNVANLLGVASDEGVPLTTISTSGTWLLNNTSFIKNINFTNKVTLEGNTINTNRNIDKTLIINNSVFNGIDNNIQGYVNVEVINSKIKNSIFTGDKSADITASLAIRGIYTKEETIETTTDTTTDTTTTTVTITQKTVPDLIDDTTQFKSFTNIELSNLELKNLYIEEFKKIEGVASSFVLKNCKITDTVDSSTVKIYEADYITIESSTIELTEGDNVSVILSDYTEDHSKEMATFIHIFDSVIKGRFLSSGKDIKVYNSTIEGNDINFEVSNHIVLSSSTLITIHEGINVLVVDGDKESCRAEVLGNIFHINGYSSPNAAITFKADIVDKGLYSGIVAFNALSNNSVISPGNTSQAIIAEMKPNRVLRVGSNIAENFSTIISTSATGITEMGNYVTDSILTQYLSKIEWDAFIEANGLLLSGNNISSEALAELISNKLSEMATSGQIDIASETIQSKTLLVRNVEYINRYFPILKASEGLILLSIEGYIRDYKEGSLRSYNVPESHQAVMLCATAGSSIDETNIGKIIERQSFTIQSGTQPYIADNMFTITDLSHNLMASKSYVILELPTCGECFIQLNYKTNNA